MKPPRAPTLETRRAKQLEEELFRRARVWIAAWGMEEDQRDFGQALLKIAARFGSEVTERLDRAGDRMRLAFLDWLAAPAEAARPARLPVVFKLTDSAREAVRAPEGTRLQVEVGGLPIILESEKDVLLLPGKLKTLVAVDADKDAFFLPPPGLSSLAPLEPLPNQWRLKSFTSAGATKLQLNPEQGLAVNLLVDVGGKQQRLAAVDKDIVTIEPPLQQEQPDGALVTKVVSFAPFDGAAQSRQEHALYLGHKELFDIEAPARIEVLGATELAGRVSWEYWGKVHPQDDVAWQPLTPASADVQAKSDGFVLEKPKGAVELREVNGENSRWIRSVTAAVRDVKPLLREDRLQVRINSRPGEPRPPDADAPAAEGMANTTPLVLDGVFFPFGKEPRQFDAFYLGCQEAFSKKGADIVLHFDLADTTFTALSAVSAIAFPQGVLAGVAKDGALYLLELDPTKNRLSILRDRGPLRPTPPGQTADVAAGLALDPRPNGRLPVWHDSADPNGFLVAAGARDSVWIRREHSSKDASGWVQWSAVPSTDPSPNVPISDLIYFTGESTLFALRGGQLSRRAWPDETSWSLVDTVEDLGGGKTRSVTLDTIVPVLTASGDALAPSKNAGMLGTEVAADADAPRKLYAVSYDGVCTSLEVAIDVDVRPLAVEHGGEVLVALKRKSLPGAILFNATTKLPKKVGLPEPDATVVGFDALSSGGPVKFLAAVKLSSGSYLASWVPTPGNDPIDVLRSEIPTGLGQPEGAPTQFSGHLAVPATGGHVLVTGFDLTRRFERQANVGEAVFAPAPAAFAATDVLVRDLDADFSIQHVSGAGTTPSGGEAYYLLAAPFHPDAKGALHGFRTSSEVTRGNVIAGTGKVQLAPQDADVAEGTLLLLKDGTVHRITHVNATLVATVDPPAADENSSVGFGYWRGAAINGRVSPFMQLDAANNNWAAAYLQYATLSFKGASPIQRGTAFKVDAVTSPTSPPRPLLVELALPWTSPPAPAAAAPFLLDAAAGPWKLSLEDPSANPELSWEYSNGTGWWKLVVTVDETRNLKTSGEIHFKAPSDIAPSDWAGRTNYWIRARLIGGDYGREKVSVAISPKDADRVRHQTIERSTRDIHAPSVMKLVIRYEVKVGVLPERVLTSDSGSQRDQSDANRTDGAMVEAFVPLGVMLGRLSDTSSTLAAAPVTGRAIYLGFDARLTAAPVKVLLLVEERPLDPFAPMSVEALVADRFVPIVVGDTTRALGESAVLTLAFSLDPTRRELFGQALTWLRLVPRGTDTTKWNPKILGAYLNGEWASAAETLTYELLGSSQGEPNLTLFLAKPPVLRNTLELRVKEPLGDEERAELKASDANSVLSSVRNLPGDWVLWSRVIDPLDEHATARVYALDDATGEIGFGDGRHGRIPPVGRNSIVAFRYRRTEAGTPDTLVVPGNTIKARAPLDLVSPVARVEAVFAADDAAGGAPADGTERVLQFGVARLRHRERALMPADFEDLALESSPDIVQARCFLRKGFARLVVVMRGADPKPTAAQIRELQRVLLEDAPPSLSAKDALQIGGPGVRRLRVDLRLRVASLDDAGMVRDDAKSRLAAVFDTATGGTDGTGWPLGENPTEGDIALALDGVARLEGIAEVKLREIAADSTEQPWPATIKVTELAMLHDEVLRVVFEPIEVLA